MRILFYEWENFGTYDMAEAFKDLGHTVLIEKTSQEGLLDPGIIQRIKKDASGLNPDILFTFNYHPNVALACRDIGLDYYSWVYDNPASALYSYTVIFPTNHVFVFDSDTYLFFNGQGIKNIEFLPMAASPERLDKLFEKRGITQGEFHSDISFVGSLYSEKHLFYDRMKPSERTAGYLRGLMESQKKVYGENIVRRLLRPDIIEDMHRTLPLEPEEFSTATKEYLFSEYVINRQITREEREAALGLLGSRFKVDLYTPDRNKRIPGCVNHGPSEFFEQTPVIFKTSKINLNITLRSIVNGIPLRCFDIMGSGGFLLTNYQGDFMNFFTPGEEFVYYDGTADMMAKAEYYLSHEDERSQIAALGREAIIRSHTFKHRALEMLGK